MSHVIELSDEQYAALETYAQRQGRSPDELIRAWVASLVEQPQADWADEPPPTEEELREHPILGLAGIFAIGEPGWADRHDEIIAEEALNTHADEE